MKKWLYGLVVVLLLAGGYGAAVHFSGGAFPTLGLPLGGDRGWLRTNTLSFWEDLQFKDFASAAAYHDPMEQNTVDIPYLLERMFLVKPEALDIMNYEIVLADIDSTGLRARIKTRVKVKNLLDESLQEKEIMLYWQRVSPADPWYMQLDSSLRQLDPDKDKKH